MKTYETLPELVDAIKRGDIPRGVISPGGAAAVLGITRQAVHNRLQRGTLRGWSAAGVVLIEVADVRLARREKREKERIRILREQRYAAIGAGTM